VLEVGLDSYWACWWNHGTRNSSGSLRMAFILRFFSWGGLFLLVWDRFLFLNSSLCLICFRSSFGSNCLLCLSYFSPLNEWLVFKTSKFLVKFPWKGRNTLVLTGVSSLHGHLHSNHDHLSEFDGNFVSVLEWVTDLEWKVQHAQSRVFVLDFVI